MRGVEQQRSNRMRLAQSRHESNEERNERPTVGEQHAIRVQEWMYLDVGFRRVPVRF